MKTSMLTAAGTLNQIQKSIDTLSHNVANINTVGYKRREASFQELLTQQINNQPRANEEIGRITPNGIRVGSGAKIGQTTLHMSQGSVQSTGRELDFMLEGQNNVFFRVLKTWENPQTGEQESEILYTRNGNFQLKVDPDNPGQVSLVTSQGYVLIDGFTENLPFEFDQDYSRIEVDERGIMRVYFDNGDYLDYALPITQINRTDLLEARGESLFGIPNAVLNNLDAYGIPGAVFFNLDPENIDQNNPPYKVKQGALEMSNVDLTKEMTELIVQQRLLQFHSRAISMADEMLGLANQLRG